MCHTAGIVDGENAFHGLRRNDPVISLTDILDGSTFYTLAGLYDVPPIALLAVSDNSATSVPLLGRGEELAQKYINTRSNIIPDMIFRIARD